MKAVLLAAGQSSRLYPFAQGIHKSMIEIMGKPLLEYTINELKNAGIKDLIIVINKDSGVRPYFEDGSKFGVNIKYIVQDKALGMGNALLLAKDEIDSDFLLLNAYHFDVGSFVKDIINKKSSDVKAVLLAKRKNSVLGQGVLKVDGKKVIEIVEKPPLGKEPSNLCVVGIYLLSKDFIKTLVDTPPEQYQLEKALTVFSQRNTVTYLEVKEDTVSLKYPWDILSIKNYLLKNIKRNISKSAKIAKSAELIGEVVVSENANIMEGVRIKGPCFIGRNVTIGNNSLLRDGVVIEDNSSVGAFIEIKNTLFMKNSKAHSGFIGDTIVGSNSRIGAQFCSGNVRLDRKNVEVLIKGKKAGSNLRSLGTFIGDDVRIGVKSTSMPGIIIGNNSIIGPSTTVLSNVSENTRYYTKFLEIVEKKRNE